MDLITIVVPCYNVESFVRRCLDTIKMQTYKKIEVILIDDGSRDNTSNILKEYSNKDKRFNYFYKENGGLSSARNLGIKMSHGKYITFIDSDDYVDKDFIKKLHNSIIHNDTVISACSIKRIYKNKSTINKIVQSDTINLKLPTAWNKMYLTSLFKKNKIEFPLGLWYEDVATTPKLTINNDVSIVDECLYNYVQNDNSIIHTCGDRVFQMFDILQNIKEYGEKNSLDAEKIEFLFIYHGLVGTMYRASFNKDFSIENLKTISDFVRCRYPNWCNNKYIKSDLSFIYRCFLFNIDKGHYRQIYFLLKHFNKFFYL